MMARGATTAAAAGATHGQFFGLDPAHATQVVNCGQDDVAGQGGTQGDVVEGGRALIEGLENRVQRSNATHKNRLPIWKTATAATHATESCKAMPKIVQRTPISRFWAASVATHGV